MFLSLTIRLFLSSAQIPRVESRIINSLFWMLCRDAAYLLQRYRESRAESSKSYFGCYAETLLIFCKDTKSKIWNVRYCPLSSVIVRYCPLSSVREGLVCRLFRIAESRAVVLRGRERTKRRDKKTAQEDKNLF